MCGRGQCRWGNVAEAVMREKAFNFHHMYSCTSAPAPVAFKYDFEISLLARFNLNKGNMINELIITVR